MQDFKLSDDECLIIHFAYTCLEEVHGLGSTSLKIDTFALSKCCEQYEIDDYMYILQICKRIVKEENLKQAN